MTILMGEYDTQLQVTEFDWILDIHISFAMSNG